MLSNYTYSLSKSRGYTASKKNMEVVLVILRHAFSASIVCLYGYRVEALRNQLLALLFLFTRCVGQVEEGA
jgi:hypothetical protein